jgi:2-polyprenyl-6-methoxyphenol hydroxylase-like FAD-dependent oxidoreductase
MKQDVLVIGAGPVGLSLAAELGMRGVSTLVIEQNDRTGNQPRAKTTNVRSMEHMRRWGIAENIREASPLAPDFPTNISFKTRLFGRRIAVIHNAFYGTLTTPNELFSERAQWIPQYKVEGVLRKHAEQLPSIDLRFGLRLEDLKEVSEGVQATIVNLENGESFEQRFRYVVGADGARSVTRGLIGARMEGQYAMAQHVNLVIRCPEIRSTIEDELAITLWFVNADSPSILSPMDVDDIWAFRYSIAGGEEYDEADARRRINAAFGRNVDVDILTVDPWSAHRLMATSYYASRIFLAGDACHLHPPFGGYGMNLGIADAVDIGWKLAAVLRGWGGEALLASYEIERRPIHQQIIDEAVANHSVLPHHLLTDDLEADGFLGDEARRLLAERILATKPREFDTLGIVLGYTYSESPIIVSDGTAAQAEHHANYIPSARPGSLAPHAWLGRNKSLYDLFGREYTLLVTRPGADADVKRITSAARDRAMPLAVVQPGVERLARLYGARLALIRPDQHVAWRADELSIDAGELLDVVRGARRHTRSA